MKNRTITPCGPPFGESEKFYIVEAERHIRLVLDAPSLSAIGGMDDRLIIPCSPAIRSIDKENRIESGGGSACLLVPVVSTVGGVKDSAVISRSPADGLRNHGYRKHIIRASILLFAPL